MHIQSRNPFACHFFFDEKPVSGGAHPSHAVYVMFIQPALMALATLLTLPGGGYRPEPGSEGCRSRKSRRCPRMRIAAARSPGSGRPV
jgi:hypothetical protein